MNEERPRAILYRRVSTREQAEGGYSLRQQAEALREWCSREGFEVLDEVEDAGHSGAFLDRPGLDELRARVEAGGVDLVVAQDRDRFAREPAYLYLLREEFAANGCAMRSLNDRGDDSPEGQLTDGILDQLAKFERAKFRERSRRGALRKVKEGRLLGSSPRPRFGFRYDADRTGYEVDEETMRIVRRIFLELADGESIRSVTFGLDRDGVPTPRGGREWSRRTIREMALDDCYRPHRVAELAGKVPPEVLAGLDPDGLYGVSHSGRVRVRKVSNSRRARENPGPAEWVGVPVRLDGSGLDAGTVDAARRTMEGNRRPAKIGDRAFELSGGIVRCAHCGRSMNAYGRRYGRASAYYYRCDSPSRTGSDCPNRRSVRAEEMEYEAQRLFAETATSGALLELFERAVEKHTGRDQQAANAERRETLAAQLAGLDDERRGYLRQNARGVINDGDLNELLAEVDEKRGAVASEMRETAEDTERIRRISDARESLLSEDWRENPEHGGPTGWFMYEAPHTGGATPEQVRAAYMRYGARFRADEGGNLELRMEIDLGGDGVAYGSQPHGNEHWEFDENGYMRRRDASINDYEIDESERRIF